MEKYLNLNAVGEIGELMNMANELEKYAHLGAVAAITEELCKYKELENTSN